MHRHIDAIDKVSHLPKNILKKWNENIPLIWTGETIYAQSVFETLSSGNQINQFKRLNFYYLYAALFVMHFKNRKQVFNGIDNQFKYTCKFWSSAFKVLFNRIGFYVKNRVKRSRQRKYRGIDSIQRASELIMVNISKGRLPFKLK